LVFHIGWHKTGSTSLQDFFHANREFLWKQAGIYYPLTGMAGTSHRAFSASLKQDAESPDRMWQQLRGELERVTDATWVLISAESLHLRQPDQLRPLLNTLPGFDRIQIIAYVRQPDQILESWYGQRLCNGDFCGRFDEFLRDIEASGWLDYEASLDRWRAVSPRVEVMVRPFERCQWPQGDLLQDFCNTLGWPDSVFRECSRGGMIGNQGWGGGMLALVRDINQTILTHGGEARTPGFLDILHRFESVTWLERPEDTKPVLFTPPQRHQLRERYRPVFERLGVRFLEALPSEQGIGTGELPEFADLPDPVRIGLLSACLKAAVLVINDYQKAFERLQCLATETKQKCRRQEEAKREMKAGANELRGRLRQLEREHRDLVKRYGRTLPGRLRKFAVWWRSLRQ
jgi:hypothetical protein